MAVPVSVRAYSGYRANERPQAFVLNDKTFEVVEVEDRWYSPGGAYFLVKTLEDNLFVLRYDETDDRWTLEREADTDTPPNAAGSAVILVGTDAIRQALSKLAGCEHCLDTKGTAFASILSAVLDEHEPCDFVLPETVRCPACGTVISEKTWVQPTSRTAASR